MNLKIYQVDAFTNQVFGGNPAAVIPMQNWLPDSVMQTIAAENNLSETAFFIPTEGEADFHLRWMTPSIEVNLCGHATLATAHTLWQHLDFKKNVVTFDSRSGILKVSRTKTGYTLDFPVDILRGVTDENELEIIRNVLKIKPLEVFRGKDDYMAILPSQADIENLDPDFLPLRHLDARGLIATAKGDNVDFVSRCFFPEAGIEEDPVTGSAHTTMVAYWSPKLNKTELAAKQLSKRQGELNCILAGNRVLISGSAVTFMVGEIFI